MSYNRRQYLLDKVIEQNESIFVNIDFIFEYQLPRIPILDKNFLQMQMANLHVCNINKNLTFDLIVTHLLTTIHLCQSNRIWGIYF